MTSIADQIARPSPGQPKGVAAKDHATPAEVSVLLRCSTTNVYDLMSGGDMAFTRIGAGKKGFRVKGSDLRSFLDARKEGGPKPKMSFKRLGL